MCRITVLKDVHLWFELQISFLWKYGECNSLEIYAVTSVMYTVLFILSFNVKSIFCSITPITFSYMTTQYLLLILLT